MKKQKWKTKVEKKCTSAEVLLEEFREMGVVQTKSPQTCSGKEWMFSGKIQFELHVY